MFSEKLMYFLMWKLAKDFNCRNKIPTSPIILLQVAHIVSLTAKNSSHYNVVLQKGLFKDLDCVFIKPPEKLW